MSAANSELKVEGFSNGPLQMPGSVSFNSSLNAALKRSFGKGENSGDFAMPGTALLASPYTKHLPILNSTRLPILSTHQAEKAFMWVVGGPRTLG